MRTSPSYPSFSTAWQSIVPAQTRKKLLPLLCTAALLLLLPVVYQGAHKRIQHHRLGYLDETAEREPFPSARSWLSNNPDVDQRRQESSKQLSRESTTGLVRGQRTDLDTRVVAQRSSGNSDPAAAISSPQAISAVPAEVLTAWAAGEGYLRSEVSTICLHTQNRPRLGCAGAVVCIEASECCDSFERPVDFRDHLVLQQGETLKPA